MKTVKYEEDGKVYTLALRKEHYIFGGRLAVCADMVSGGFVGEPFAVLTVNLDGSQMCGENEAYIDVNNCPWAPALLEENGIAAPVGVFGISGYCAYPLYKFDIDKLN